MFKIILCTIVGLSLSSCCLSKSDRQLLNQAVENASEAKLWSEAAVIEASRAAEKSERIFKQLHKK